MFANDYLNNWDTICKIVDINSLINFLIVEEITRNGESYNPKSTFMHKDAAVDSKLKFGPAWDFDWRYGCISNGYNTYFNNYEKILFHSEVEGADLPAGRIFFSRFFHFPQFIKQYKAVWNKSFSLFNFDNFINNYAKNISKYASEDYNLWNQHTFINNPTYNNFDEAIAELKNFLTLRCNYLNTQINSW